MLLMALCTTLAPPGRVASQPNRVGGVPLMQLVSLS